MTKFKVKSYYQYSGQIGYFPVSGVILITKHSEKTVTFKDSNGVIHNQKFLTMTENNIPYEVMYCNILNASVIISSADDEISKAEGEKRMLSEQYDKEAEEAEIYGVVDELHDDDLEDCVQEDNSSNQQETTRASQPEQSEVPEEKLIADEELKITDDWNKLDYLTHVDCELWCIRHDSLAERNNVLRLKHCKTPEQAIALLNTGDLSTLWTLTTAGSAPFGRDHQRKEHLIASIVIHLFPDDKIALAYHHYAFSKLYIDDPANDDYLEIEYLGKGYKEYKRRKKACNETRKNNQKVIEQCKTRNEIFALMLTISPRGIYLQAKYDRFNIPSAVISPAGLTDRKKLMIFQKKELAALYADAVIRRREKKAKKSEVKPETPIFGKCPVCGCTLNPNIKLCKSKTAARAKMKTGSGVAEICDSVRVKCKDCGHEVKTIVRCSGNGLVINRTKEEAIKSAAIIWNSPKKTPVAPEPEPENEHTLTEIEYSLPDDLCYSDLAGDNSAPDQDIPEAHIPNMHLNKQYNIPTAENTPNQTRTPRNRNLVTSKGNLPCNGKSISAGLLDAFKLMLLCFLLPLSAIFELAVVPFADFLMSDKGTFWFTAFTLGLLSFHVAAVCWLI